VLQTAGLPHQVLRKSFLVNIWAHRKAAFCGVVPAGGAIALNVQGKALANTGWAGYEDWARTIPFAQEQRQKGIPD
jgi:hypothetical protein